MLNFLIRYILPQLMGQPQKQQQQPHENVIGGETVALLDLKRKSGAVALILGRRESGKTVLAYRVAEFLGRPTYAVTPNQPPLHWMKRISLEGVSDVPPDSTLILDDLPVYMSSRDYSDAAAKEVERLIPVVRHKKIILVFISQTSGFADRWCMDADVIFIKPSSILYADIERPAVKKLMDKAAPYFVGKSPEWLKRHSYMVTNSFEGLIAISIPKG